MMASAAELAPIQGCRSCGSRKLSVFLSLGNLPLSDGLLRADQLQSQEPRYPLDVAFCEDCSLVQIMHTVPPQELFGADYPYLSSFTDTVVRNAATNVAARLKERALDHGSLVIEVASNDGYLLQHYRAAGVPVLGIDPAPTAAAAARARGVETLEDFFGRDLAERLAATGRQADVLHANNVLAHVADTNGFVGGIAAVLKPDGVAVIEVPYVRELIRNVEYDTIYHQHLCYFSVTAVHNLFRRHGLFLNRVEHLPIHGGSLRLFAERTDRPEAVVRELLDAERDEGITEFGFYRDFSRKVARLRERLRELIGDLRAGGATIAGYGAAAKGTILLNHAGLGSDVIDFVVDRNTFKQGKWVPGVRLPILPPDAILERQPDFVLILPWNFKDEILAQQADYLRSGGRFIVPVPEPVVVGGPA
jgi:SAM-dependent methyltransferase